MMALMLHRYAKYHKPTTLATIFCIIAGGESGTDYSPKKETAKGKRLEWEKRREARVNGST